MKIFTIRYKNTNYYFINSEQGILAFDAGWPNTYSQYKDLMKREGLRIKDIKWLLVSHFHMDHAGLAGILVNNGVQFVIFKNQYTAIADMETLITSKEKGYYPIDLNKITDLELTDSRNWLNSIGLKGEVIQTNGHGEQHISLLLDSGEAFIGDLPPENMVGENDHFCLNNWKELKSKGARTIYPAHAPEYIIS